MTQHLDRKYINKFYIVSQVEGENLKLKEENLKLEEVNFRLKCFDELPAPLQPGHDRDQLHKDLFDS